MSCRILSVQFCSSSVDVHVLWQETKIEKKRERESVNINLDLQCWFSIQCANPCRQQGAWRTNLNSQILSSGLNTVPFCQVRPFTPIPKLDPKMNPGLDLKLDFQNYCQYFHSKVRPCKPILSCAGPCSKPAL